MVTSEGSARTALHGCVQIDGAATHAAVSVCAGAEQAGVCQHAVSLAAHQQPHWQGGQAGEATPAAQQVCTQQQMRIVFLGVNGLQTLGMWLFGDSRRALPYTVMQGDGITEQASEELLRLLHPLLHPSGL
jgi:hypothetical protein